VIPTDSAPIKDSEDIIDRQSDTAEASEPSETLSLFELSKPDAKVNNSRALKKRSFIFNRGFTFTKSDLFRSEVPPLRDQYLRWRDTVAKVSELNSALDQIIAAANNLSMANGSVEDAWKY
jgi:hypothetical protein